MSISYLARFLCLSLAAFFLAHLVLTAIVSGVAARVVAKAARISARDGARLLFAIRLAPSVLAGALVAGVCAPSYFWLEPRASAEEIGWSCLLAAICGAVCWTRSIARALSAAVRSCRCVRDCQPASESDAPVLMLAGVFHPRLVVSRGVRRGLTVEELAVAVRHEEAHGASHDNLKRLLLLLAPEPVPFLRGLGGLERAWRRMAEWAADDRAVDGSPERSLALASALVRVARMGAAPALAMATSFLGDRNDLSARVERLLAGGAADTSRRRSWPAVALAVAITAVAVQPATFVAAHRVLEALAH